MVIQPHSVIKEIQTGFSKAFPFLKLELYWVNEKGTSSPEVKAKPDQRMLHGNKMRNGHEIEINGNTRISELQNAFKEYGAHIKIYRKAGRVWIETSLTGDWTLERQNLEGEAFTNEFS